MAADTKNFKVSEFTCHCGCGFNIAKQKLINLCQKIRDKIGVPIHINSGCRCKKYNAKEGGIANSYHTQGMAADLSCSLGSRAIFEAVKELHKAGAVPELRWCKRYINKNFVHVDIGRERQNIFTEGN